MSAVTSAAPDVARRPGWAPRRTTASRCPAVPRDVARQLPERLQELLGDNICPPFLGYVDGRHPRRALSAES